LTIARVKPTPLAGASCTTSDGANTAALIRFWAKVDKSGECWVWTAGTSSLGYGAFKLNGRTLAAHRFSYENAFGPIPDGLDVLHRCDNRPCVRPDHFFLGTDADNARDRVAKGRNGTLRGERSPNAILTNESVALIKVGMANGESMTSLARRFGVSISAVWCIKRGLTWVDA